METWRVASMKRSSTTRNYIGAMDSLEDLRTERGAFGSVEEFYAFWRSQAVRRAPSEPEPEAVEPEVAIGP